MVSTRHNRDAAGCTWGRLTGIEGNRIVATIHDRRRSRRSDRSPSSAGQEEQSAMTQSPTNRPKTKGIQSAVSRRSILKAATGAAAGFYAFGLPGKSYQRALAQDDIRQQLLATNDPEEAGQIALRTQVAEGAFQGQTVRFQGLSNANFHVNVFRPLARAWEEHTGATVEWIEVTQADSYPKMFQAISSDTVNFDILEASGGWEGDLLGGGHCLPMPDTVRNDPGYAFDDIVPYLQEPTRTWEGVLYGASIDGDMHHFNFRKDVFADQDLGAEWSSSGGEGEWGPPTTWQQVQAMSEFLSGKEFEGAPLYGQLDSFRVDNTSQYFFHSRASAYGKHPDDPAFLFDLDMTPRINSPAFVRALEDMIAGLEWAPPDQQNADLLQNLGLFLAGTGTMCHWWADVGSNVYTNDQSIVQGKVGYSILPGSPDVYNHATKAWDNLPEPNAAPYLAFLGWGLYVMKVAETEGVVDAAWDLISHLSGKDISAWMSVYPSGMNPWRESHFEAAEWEVSGFPVAEAEEYLNSIRDSYNHPNRIVDLRIPGVGQY
ncbi:MAG: extracellular solute-binding protein, partial [Chloroflexota bacterium]|nr:extracellular solute-binding protein [Chloroflexota bacterium]